MDFMIEKELKEIVGKGAFGKDCNLVSFKLHDYMIGEEEWSYRRIFCDVTTSDGSHHNIMIKLKLKEYELRKCFESDLIFHNELILYEKIIPFLFECRGPTVNDDNVFFVPRYFYGYYLSNEIVFLDNDHVTVALRTIAKSHGLSYTAKHKEPGKFHDIMAGIKNTLFAGNGHWMAQNGLLKKCGRRGVERLLERNGNRYRDHPHLRLLNELFDDAENTLIQTMAAREPLSVICHCDYHRDTLMFQYDECGRPFDALTIDFFMLHYGSPALDLSSFLYMSTTQRMRETHWHDFMDTYCATLAASVPPGVHVPGRAEIDAEMAATAIYGLARASFCLPFMLRVRSDELDSLAMSDDPVDYFLALGGDLATECLADIVQHLVDMGYTNVQSN
ncbi:uncharacterized protein LOC111038229 isoform X2 [Myzus persicae]|uniref:uncharacterized protein LOC111038229 isoform X2 n=1 Tax=Myzus persicae TaxID=13164 RepID=UPI000B932956|nr:uncharacterized protein LOC111038229 isoform X2 [Myzus persicae]